MQTYWLNLNDTSETSSGTGKTLDSTQEDFDGKIARRKSVLALGLAVDEDSRLVSWNVEIMTLLLRKIVAHRNSQPKVRRRSRFMDKSKEMTVGDSIVLDEVREVIEFDDSGMGDVDPETVELSPKVLGQLKSFVAAIALVYNTNPFHCFEHASHVTMSISKVS